MDIERITIENLIDGDNYRWVLYPGENIDEKTKIIMMDVISEYAYRVSKGLNSKLQMMALVSSIIKKL